MAQDLPRYIARTPIQPGPFTSSAPAFEALARTAGTVQKITETKLQQQATQQAIIRGEEAGGQVGFKPVKGTGEAVQAFNKSALTTNKLLVGKQISVHFQQLAQQAVSDFPDANQAIISYRKSGQQYSEQLLQSIPKENDSFARNLLMYHASVGLNGLQKKATSQNQLRTFAEYVDTASQYKEDALKAVEQGNMSEALSLLSQKKKADEMALLGGAITKKQFEKSVSDDQLSINKTAAIEGYRQALATGRGDQFIQSLTDKKFPGLDDEDKFTFIKTTLLGKVRNATLQGIGINKASVAQQSKDELVAIRHGAEPNQKIQTAVALANPDHIEQYNEDVRDAQVYNGVVSTAKTLPLGSQVPFVDQFRPRDANAPDFARKMRNFDAMMSGMNQFQQQMFGEKADAVAVLNTHPEIIDALTQRENAAAVNVTGQQHPNVSINQKLLDPNERLINAQIQSGRSPANVQLLTNASAKALVNQIARMAPLEQVENFRGLKAQYGEHFPIMMNDLARQGLLPSANFISKVDPNSSILPEISEAITTPSKELREAVDSDRRTEIDDLIKTEDDSDLSNYLDTFTTFKSNTTSKQAAAFKNFTKNVAYRLAAGDKNLAADDAVARASQSITDNFTFKTIDGVLTRIPNRFNPGSVKAFALQQEKNLKTFPFQISEGAKRLPDSRRRDFLQRVLPGHWSTNSLETGMIYVDINGQPVHDKDGNMFQFTFKDAVRNFAPDYGTFGYYERKAFEKLNSVLPAVQSTEEFNKLTGESFKKISPEIASRPIAREVHEKIKKAAIREFQLNEALKQPFSEELRKRFEKTAISRLKEIKLGA